MLLAAADFGLFSHSPPYVLTYGGEYVILKGKHNRKGTNMECRFTRCNNEATNTEYVLCKEHAAHHEKCLEWGQLHIEGKVTTEDHPDYCPIVVNAN